MIDTHVVALYYRLEISDGFSVIDKSSIVVETSEFLGALEFDMFLATMSQHYATEQDARIPVDRWLRSWEISIGLKRKETTFRFKFIHAEIADRAPPDRPSGSFSHAAFASLTSTASGSLHIALPE